MAKTFKLVDSLVKLGAKTPFGVNDDGVHVFECLRLLCGTVDLEEKSTGALIRNRHCFLTERKRRLSSNTIKSIISTALDDEFSLQEVQKYLEGTRQRNRLFWSSVVAEICLTLVARDRKDFTLAFLYVYRLLEMTSVALPLFYAKAEHDYKKSLFFLKSLPQNPNDGDLAILRKFVEIIAREGNYVDHMISIPYSRGDFNWDARFEVQIQNCVIQPDVRGVNLDAQAKVIEVPFSVFPRFLVGCRNRLFHNALSAENFDLDLLYGADMVCEPLIDPALNWFTLMLCVILKQSVGSQA